MIETPNRPQVRARKRGSQIPTDEPQKLPEVARDGRDLEAILKSLVESASIGGGLWLSYLFVLLYIAIAAGAVTHKDLLLGSPVKVVAWPMSRASWSACFASASAASG
jgi:hypothetical protein